MQFLNMDSAFFDEYVTTTPMFGYDSYRITKIEKKGYFCYKV